jgi:hypothetical protein
MNDGPGRVAVGCAPPSRPRQARKIHLVYRIIHMARASNRWRTLRGRRGAAGSLAIWLFCKKASGRNARSVGGRFLTPRHPATRSEIRDIRLARKITIIRQKADNQRLAPAQGIGLSVGASCGCESTSGQRAPDLTAMNSLARSELSLYAVHLPQLAARCEAALTVSPANRCLHPRERQSERPGNLLAQAYSGVYTIAQIQGRKACKSLVIYASRHPLRP